MTRKVAHPEVRTPTDQWSGLHLSKSADLHAFKKEVWRLLKQDDFSLTKCHLHISFHKTFDIFQPAKVEKEVTERQSPSREVWDCVDSAGHMNKSNKLKLVNANTPWFLNNVSCRRQKNYLPSKDLVARVNLCTPTCPIKSNWSSFMQHVTGTKIDLWRLSHRVNSSSITLRQYEVMTFYCRIS